MTNRIF